MTTATPSLPALWHEPAPSHFDLRVVWWVKCLAVIAATVAAVWFIDQPLAAWCDRHRIPDLLRLRPDGRSYGDSGRELMFLEQFGQFACSVVVILAVAILDPKGRRRALSITIACLLTVALTHLTKDLVGRSRPFVAPDSTDGHWLWGGPAMGFHKGSAWGSLPSAHTTAAFALASSLAWFYPRARGFFMTLALITAAQRVLHMAHYLSDVIAGLGIGVFVARLTLASKLAGRLIALAPTDVRTWWLHDTE